MSFPVELLDYDLPQSAIAQSGVEPRDAARMLVVHRNKYHPDKPEEEWIEHRQVRDLPDYLQAGDVILRNRSSVLKARLIVTRIPGYGKGEVFVLKITEKGKADCLIRNFGRNCIGKEFFIGVYHGFVSKVTENSGVYEVHFLKDDQLFNVETIIDKHGITPLPPYIHNKQVLQSRYETLYALEKGSVAAPTAGLHFTEELDNRLLKKSVSIKELLLHVGLGTFKSVTVPNLDQHQMHNEEILLPKEIEQILTQHFARILAVGTTTVRVIETPFNHYKILPNGDLIGSTNCFIYPPYQYRNVDMLLTNFHLPRSTLLALTMAFAGQVSKHPQGCDSKRGIDMVKNVYRIALEKGYRFFSLGDATLWL